MFAKAEQVRVREYLEESEPYEFDGLLIGTTLIALDNGAIINAKSDHIEIIKKYPWIPISLGE